MASDPQVYVCTSEGCVLGTTDNPGKFTGGISSGQKFVLTGQPEDQQKEGQDYGEGICPNCGKPGQKFTQTDAKKEALASAKAAYDAQVAQIEEDHS